MDKTKQLKKLTWKYFWQQKLKEFLFFIGIASIVIFVPYYFGVLTCKVIGERIEGLFFLWTWILGALLLVLVMLIGMFIFWVIKEIVRLNWEKAQIRAKEELGIK